MDPSDQNKEFKQHKYLIHAHWSGSTSNGYQNYDRSHSLFCPSTQDSIDISADPAFLGNPNILNPEQLLLMAAVSCQLLSFLALAARARIKVLDYKDEAEAFMDEKIAPVRINLIRLHPNIYLGEKGSEDKILRLVNLAHKECFIANTLNCEMEIIPKLVF